MDNYNITFYDLLSRALGDNTSSALQSFLDEAIARKYNALQLDGFEFDPFMQDDFTFSQLIAEVGVNAAAQYYDLDSPAIPDAAGVIKEYTGKIPRMKKVEYFNEDKLRKMLLMENRRDVSDDRIAEIAYEQLFITVDKLVGGHTNALTFQRHQAISKGEFAINSTNNPNGIGGVKIDYHIPAAKKTTLQGTARWWTSSTHTQGNEGPGSNPVNDLQTIVAKARKLGIRGHFEIEIDYLREVLGHSKVTAALGVALLPGADATVQANYAGILDYERRKSTLEAIVGAPIKAIDSVTYFQKVDASTRKITTTPMTGFVKDVVVFVPDGNIGVVKTVRPVAISGGVYGSFYDGRLLLTIGVDAVKKCQSYNTEMTSIVVPTAVNYFFYLYPNNA